MTYKAQCDLTSSPATLWVPTSLASLLFLTHVDILMADSLTLFKYLFKHDVVHEDYFDHLFKIADCLLALRILLTILYFLFFHMYKFLTKHAIYLCGNLLFSLFLTRL